MAFQYPANPLLFGPPPPPFDVETSQAPLQSAYLKFQDTLLSWFHEPDLEAVRVYAAILLSHYVLTEKAIWAFLIGESSIGKTAAYINPFSKITSAHIMSKITPKAFLSGHAGGTNSLLRRAGSSAIWLFKDFTTILQTDYKDRDQIMTALREIWDGEFSNETGADAKRNEWKGKITAVAATTYAIDRYWGSLADLGERFLQIKVKPPNPEGVHLAAMLQISHGQAISDSLQDSATKWIKAAYNQWLRADGSQRVFTPTAESLRIPPDSAVPPSHYSDALFSFAFLVANCRRTTHWDYNRKEIVRLGKVEMTPRVSRSFWLLMLSHARLFGRRTPDDHDFRIAQRLALDSIADDRRSILLSIPLREAISYDSLRKALSDMPLRQFKETLEELISIGIIERNISTSRLSVDEFIGFTPAFQRHAQVLLSPISLSFQQLSDKAPTPINSRRAVI